ncbi:MAG: hypothetical protein ACN4GR_15260 [Arenicellales bacterium]
MNKTHAVFVDAHVHFYDCFDLSTFINAAQKNFSNAAAEAGIDNDYSAVLLLSERSSENWFQWLVDAAKEGPAIDHVKRKLWWLQYNDKDASIKVLSDHFPPIYIIPGRQVVTRESLEVLLLGTLEKYDDKVSLTALLESVRDRDVISVLPWGVGKWFGKRGELVRNTIINETGQNLFVGDIAGRPAIWPQPSLFSLAEKKGIRLLQGTDPLPIAVAAAMPGSYGFSIKMPQPGSISAKRIKKEILNPETITTPYGLRENPLEFMRNQILLRVRSN